MQPDSQEPKERRRPRSDAVRNRAAIVHAALSALGQGDALNLQRLASMAGVSRSTLHRHFPTRSALEDALREQALAEAMRLIQEAASQERAPLATLRQLVSGLVEVAARCGFDPLGLVPLGERGAELWPSLIPAGDRLRRAVELEPEPKPQWVLQVAEHFLELCLAAGTGSAADPGSAADALFRALTESLDQGLVFLAPSGSLVCENRWAARLLHPTTPAEPGEPLPQPGIELVYEDGSPCPRTEYPLDVALRTEELRHAVLGHRMDDGSTRWVSVEARPLRSPSTGAVYAVLGILADVTRETDWERAHMLPPGGLAPTRAVPLDIARILDEIPPHLFPEQFVSEARRIAGGPVALYVLDIDGTHLLRLAGADDFPDRIESPLALGPELAEDGIPDLRARLESTLPGVSVAPMWLRGRAIGLLLGLGAPKEGLVELGRHGAAAMELANGYTDVMEGARRRKETMAAAELQQSLLPPRIARIGGGELAGSVLPSYEVGGDWFDYVENRDGAWIAIADAVGKGATAGALGGIALAALRAARRSDQSLEEAAQAMHEVVHDVGRPEFFLTALIARWNAVYSVFSWINCGHPPPLVVTAEDQIEQLPVGPDLPLGVFERERRFVRRQRRIDAGERLILHSDGITARKTESGLFGIDGVAQAVHRAASRSATAIARSIQEAVMRASEDPLQDDAVAIVLAPAPSGAR